MSGKRQRLTLVLVGLTLLAGATGLSLAALNETVMFFHSPTDLAQNPPAPDRRLRLGGLVEAGSVARDDQGHVRFAVSDGTSSVEVRFAGVLPDLFREGQGVVTEGLMDAGGWFAADEVLAKHDETYMPPEVAEALRAQGHWQGE
ncbi:MAG: cytochrome c maturation protein CcmE [Alphaproteobacteria bacterium]